MIDPADQIRTILATRHPDAGAAFWAGSLSRGQGTTTSDIDLVIVHHRLDNAWRHCVEIDGRLCDIFVHDPTSLDIFFAKDVDRGRPTMMAMIAEGIPLIEGPLADHVVAMARQARCRPSAVDHGRDRAVALRCRRSVGRLAGCHRS